METLRERLAGLLRERMARSVSLSTQTKVAQRAQVSQSTVQRLLSCEQSATLDVIEQLAHAFGVRAAELFLLGDDELRLLSEWRTLDEASRLRVLGFIEAMGSQSRYRAPSVSVESERFLPESVQLQMVRASQRPATTQEVVGSGHNEEQRRPKRSAPSPGGKR